jgi:hypothetical protein
MSCWKLFQRKRKGSELMAKKNVFGIVLGVFLVLVLLVSSVFFVVQQTGVGGFTVLSVTSPDISTTSKSLDDFNWEVVATLGGSDRIVGSISPSDLESKSGQRSSLPLSIEMVALDTDDEGTFVFNPPSCPSGFTWQVLEQNAFANDIRHCIKRDQIGIHGVLQSPKVGFEAEMTLSAGDVSITEKISDATRSVLFSEGGVNYARAQWVGSLVTGDSLPRVDVYEPVIKTGGNWYFVSNTNWDKYVNSFDAFERDLSSTPLNVDERSDSDVKSEINSWISSYNQGLSLVDNRVSVGGTLQDADSTDNAKLVFELDRRINVQVVTFLVSADWIGFEIRVGEPRITGVDCPKFGSGETGSVGVDLRNVGDGTGVFDVSLSDCEFKQLTTGFSNEVTLSSGASSSMKLPISVGAVNENIRDVCRVTVFDVADPSSKDTETVTCEVTTAVICTANSVSVEGSCIKKCSADGSVVELVGCCDYGVGYNPSTEEYVCNPKPTTLVNGVGVIGACGFFDVSCKLRNVFAGFFLPVKIIVSLIGVFLGFLISLSMIRRLKLLKPKEDVLAKSLSAVIGVLFGVFIFFVFTVALIILGVFIVVRIIMGKKK